MPFIRRIAVFLLVAWSGVAAAQGDYPNKPIRMLIPLAAASAVDNAARVLAARMSENMGQQIIVENMPGAAGLIGAERVARSAPDGYTIGAFNDSIMTMLPNLHAKMPWDTLKDFEPVSLVGTIEWGLVVANDAPYKSAADLISAATANPGKINYASGGNGSPQHVAMALFASTANVSLTHVPYKGATQAATDIAAGQVPIGMQGLGTVAALVRGGKLRLIGVATPQRHPQFPDVPTIAESGLPGFQFNSWFTIVAPAGTPKDIIVRLNAEIVRALAAPDVREKLVSQGFTIRGTSQDELASATRVQLARYARLMKEAGIKAE
ncbi:MAG TPA: tripartite tricarboxylate transporter substrate binding protein [Burkholderiales bacterium]|nr:tripartite tricarboxylate transporter substrate binding protein [Burkholderiales bacterium]